MRESDDETFQSFYCAVRIVSENLKIERLRKVEREYAHYAFCVYSVASAYDIDIAGVRGDCRNKIVYVLDLF